MNTARMLNFAIDSRRYSLAFATMRSRLCVFHPLLQFLQSHPPVSHFGFQFNLVPIELRHVRGQQADAPVEGFEHFDEEFDELVGV